MGINPKYPNIGRYLGLIFLANIATDSLTIIHITNNNSKKNFIVNRPALFIDDSFTERASCAADDIYVFDVDSYELVRDCIRFRNTHE